MREPAPRKIKIKKGYLVTIGQLFFTLVHFFQEVVRLTSGVGLNARQLFNDVLLAVSKVDDLFHELVVNVFRGERLARREVALWWRGVAFVDPAVLFDLFECCALLRVDTNHASNQSLDFCTDQSISSTNGLRNFINKNKKTFGKVWRTNVVCGRDLLVKLLHIVVVKGQVATEERKENDA